MGLMFSEKREHWIKSDGEWEWKIRNDRKVCVCERVKERDEMSAGFNQVRTLFDIYEQFCTGGDQYKLITVGVVNQTNVPLLHESYNNKK